MGCLAWTTLLVVVLAVALGVFVVHFEEEVKQGLQMSNGYGAKIGCSVVFVAGRSLTSALEAEFVFPPIRLFSRLDVEPESKCVVATSRFFPGLEKRACWKSPRLGCALEHADARPDGAAALSKGFPAAQTTSQRSDAFPLGDSLDHKAVAKAQANIDIERLRRIADTHVDDARLHTRALLVIKDGQIIYERYGDGCNATTRLLGWSMTKSWLNILLGRRVHEGGIPQGLDAQLGTYMPEYAHDDRGKLRLEEVLRMIDGLDLDEYYTPMADTTKMLFTDSSLVQAHLGFRAPQNASKCFRYSSHASNVASKFLQGTFATHKEYLRFPTEALFEKLGMHSAVMETDPSGTFIGSSFGWATARDWARFGTFLLQDGVWNNTRLLPENWMRFSTSPTPTSRGVHGAHFWGNLGPALGPDESESDLATCDERFSSRVNPRKDWYHEAFPRGTFVAHGFEEQAVVVAPKSRVILVRLGQIKPLVVSWEQVDFYRSLLDAAGAPHNESQVV
ncbi:6-aminohexanoate-dimer hydrolase [Hondaea fermentalgiana]|uniref:6-aminohexanoate-dimer hydrolase n=1 Tax=Hondaea fermentalgiana TaxID=2315210 RepID=A0A2R5G9L6_9STRA|nr:6-aminohexanoate-dimer hydrolase [Hondaea fermentalgiana]|eukprot:GBG27245.1 6-aminohexanoate-dimer hydrolase [Hondaea fermentalgiana]